MNLQADFRTDFQLRQTQEHVEGIGNPPIGRVFQGDNAKIGMAAVNFLENRRDAADAHEFDRLAEAFDSCQDG